ncbi:hypothetical protein DFH27DRAFT_617836 [Peziza echinospora]|nr:hypothetical protein DFH27DRAFT_617836 [Peziza echinospora]
MPASIQRIMEVAAARQALLEKLLGVVIIVLANVSMPLVLLGLHVALNLYRNA